MKLTFLKQNKLALSLLGISVTLTTITLIILYIRFKKMKDALTPLKGKITSKFGIRVAPVTGASTNHNGVDIAAPLGSPIVAPLDGTVDKKFSDDGGGYQLVIKHSNGYKTGYAHLSKYNVNSVGEKVKQGAVIAYVGNSGKSTGAHLHFTVTNPMGIKVNPEDFFKFS